MLSTMPGQCKVSRQTAPCPLGHLCSFPLRSGHLAALLLVCPILMMSWLATLPLKKVLILKFWRSSFYFYVVSWHTNKSRRMFFFSLIWSAFSAITCYFLVCVQNVNHLPWSKGRLLSTELDKPSNSPWKHEMTITFLTTINFGQILERSG